MAVEGLLLSRSLYSLSGKYRLELGSSQGAISGLDRSLWTWNNKGV